jgi:hypothetical protein
VTKSRTSRHVLRGDTEDDDFATAASGPDDVWAGGGLTPPNGNSSDQVLLHYTC